MSIHVKGEDTHGDEWEVEVFDFLDADRIYLSLSDGEDGATHSLTVKQARKLRKALKRATEAVTGEAV